MTFKLSDFKVNDDVLFSAGISAQLRCDGGKVIAVPNRRKAPLTVLLVSGRVTQVRPLDVTSITRPAAMVLR